VARLELVEGLDVAGVLDAVQYAWVSVSSASVSAGSGMSSSSWWRESAWKAPTGISWPRQPCSRLASRIATVVSHERPRASRVMLWRRTRMVQAVAQRRR
jgi:hypothetical protein